MKYLIDKIFENEVNLLVAFFTFVIVTVVSGTVIYNLREQSICDNKSTTVQEYKECTGV
jgi:hypothetical protein